MIKHPFEGIKVVDLTSYIAGAYATALLADMGADVIKVESPVGDGFRALAGAFDGWNRGKRSISLDLSSPEGKAILYDMVRRADVVAENYRPGVSKKLEMDYQALANINTKIIYCTIIGYGSSGPFSDQPAFDPLMQAQGGVMEAQGRNGTNPVFLRVPVSDYAAAIMGAAGIAMALRHRIKTGSGQRLETSLVNSVIAFQAAEFFLYSGKSPEASNTPLGFRSTYRIYQTQDGWFFLSCEDDDSWAKLCQALNIPPDIAALRTARDRSAKDEEITANLARVFQHNTTSHWLALLRSAAVRCAPVKLSQDMHNEPQALINGLSTNAVSPILGKIKQLGLPVKMSLTPGEIRGPAPTLGQHTNEILVEMGKTQEEIASLHRNGVVR